MSDRRWLPGPILIAVISATSPANAQAAQNYAAGVCRVADFKVIGTDTPGTSVRPTYDADTYMFEYQGKSDSPLKKYATDKYPLDEAKTKMLVSPRHGKLIWDPGTPSNISAARKSFYYYVSNKGYSGEDGFVMRVEKYGLEIDIHYTIKIPEADESPRGLCIDEFWMIARVDAGAG